MSWVSRETLTSKISRGSLIQAQWAVWKSSRQLACIASRAGSKCARSLAIKGLYSAKCCSNLSLQLAARYSSSTATEERTSAAALGKRLPESIQSVQALARADKFYSGSHADVHACIIDVCEAMHLAMQSGNSNSVKDTLQIVHKGLVRGVKLVQEPQRSEVIRLISEAIAIGTARISIQHEPGSASDLDNSQIAEMADIQESLLCIAVATLPAGDASIGATIAPAVTSTTASAIHAIGHARSPSASSASSAATQGESHLLGLSRAVSLFRTLQQMSFAWRPASPDNSSAAVAESKAALLDAIVPSIKQLPDTESLRLSRAVLSDFDSLCSTSGRTVAVFGMRRASVVLSRFLVPLEGDVAMDPAALRDASSLDADAEGIHKVSQALAAAMNAKLRAEAVDLVAAAGRAVESQGAACGPSLRLAVPRARLPADAVRDLEQSMARPCRVIGESLKLVVLRATGQATETDADAIAGNDVPVTDLLTSQEFNTGIISALGRHHLTQLLCSLEQLGGGVPADADSLRDIADWMASPAAAATEHPLLARMASQEDSAGVDDVVPSTVPVSALAPASAQDDAASALRGIAMRMDLQSPTRSVLSAALLAPSRNAGLEALGAPAYVGAVRMGIRAVGMATSDFQVSHQHMKHAINAAQESGEGLVTASDDALVTLGAAVQDARRALEGVRVGLSVLRRSVGEQSLREASQSMHAALEALRAVESTGRSREALLASVDGLHKKLTRATRGATGRRRTNLVDLREGVEMLRESVGNPVLASLNQVDAAAKTVIDAVARNISQSLDRSMTSTGAELKFDDVADLSRAVIRLGQARQGNVTGLVAGAARAMTRFLQQALVDASLDALPSRSKQDVVQSLVRIHRALDHAGIRSSGFNKAAAEAFAAIASGDGGSSLRAEDAVQMLYNLQVAGFGRGQEEHALFRKVGSIVDRISAHATAHVCESATLWAAEAKGGEAALDESRIGDLKTELFEELLPRVRSVCLATWCRCIVEEHVSERAVLPLEQALHGLFQASRNLSSEIVGESGDSLAVVQSQVLRSLGPEAMIQMRQIQLTLERFGTEGGLRQLSLPPRLRFAVQNALTAEASPSEIQSQLQSNVLQAVRGRMGFKPFYREYLTDEQLYLDAAWPDHMICLEVDGPHHFLPVDIDGMSVTDLSSGVRGVSTQLNATTRWKSRILEAAGWDVRRVAFFEWTGSDPGSLLGSTEAETILSADEQERLLRLRLPSDLEMTTDEKAAQVLRQTGGSVPAPSADEALERDGFEPSKPDTTEISERVVGTADELMGGVESATFDPTAASSTAGEDVSEKLVARVNASLSQLDVKQQELIRVLIKDGGISRKEGIDSSKHQAALDGTAFRIAPASQATKARNDIRKLLSMPAEDDDTMHALLRLLSRRPGLAAPYLGILQQLDRVPLGTQAEARLEALLQFSVDAHGRLRDLAEAMAAGEKNGTVPESLDSSHSTQPTGAARTPRPAPHAKGRRRRVRPIKPSMYRRIRPRRLTGGQLTSLAQRGMMSQRILMALSKQQLASMKPSEIRSPVMRHKLLRAIGQAQARDEAAFGSRLSAQQSSESFHAMLGKHSEEGRKMEAQLRAIEASRKSMESMWTRIPHRTMFSFSPRRQNQSAIRRILQHREREPSIHIPAGRARENASKQSMTRTVLKDIASAKRDMLIQPTRKIIVSAARQRMVRLANLRRTIRASASARRKKQAAMPAAASVVGVVGTSETPQDRHVDATFETHSSSGPEIEEGVRSASSEDDFTELLRLSLPLEVTEGATSVDEVMARMNAKLARMEVNASSLSRRGRQRRASSRVERQNSPGDQVSPSEQLRLDKLELASSAIPSGEVIESSILSKLQGDRRQSAAAMDQMFSNDDSMLAFADFLIHSNAPGTEHLRARSLELAQSDGTDSLASEVPASLGSVVTDKELEIVRKYSADLRSWQESRALLRQRQSKGFDMAKALPPPPTPPPDLQVRSPRARQARLSSLLGDTTMLRDNKERAGAPQGPLEALVRIAEAQKETTSSMRRRGAELPPEVESRRQHLVSHLGIPDDLAKVAALRKPANDYQREIIELVDEFEATAEVAGNNADALQYVGVSKEAIQAIKQARDLAETNTDSNDGWAKQEALDRAHAKVESLLGVSSSAFLQADERLRRLQEEGLSLGEAAHVVFGDNDDAARKIEEASEGVDTATARTPDRVTPAKARMLLAQDASRVATVESVDEQLNRKLLRKMLARLPEVSVIEPAHVDLSRPSMQRTLLTRSALEHSIMEVCAEFEHDFGREALTEDALAARSRIEELRSRARQIRKEVQLLGDTDWHGRPVKSGRGAALATTHGRRLPLQFIREEEVRPSVDTQVGSGHAGDKQAKKDDPFGLLSGLMEQFNALQAEDDLLEDSAAVDIDRMAKEAEEKIKGGRLAGDIASLEDVSSAQVTQQQLAAEAKKALDHIGVDFEAFKAGDPDAVRVATQALAKRQAGAQENELGISSQADVRELIDTLRDTSAGTNGGESDEARVDVSTEASIRFQGVLGAINEPVRTLRDIVGQSRGDVLDDADWFASQTPQQLGLMRGRRIISKRGMRALGRLHSAMEDQDEKGRLSSQGQGQGKSSTGGLTTKRGARDRRQKLTNKAQASSQRTARRGARNGKIFGESTSHLDRVVDDVEKQAGEAMQRVSRRSPFRRAGAGGSLSKSRRTKGTWDDDEDSAMLSNVERRHEAVDAEADEMQMRDFMRLMEAQDQANGGAAPIRDLTSKLAGLGSLGEHENLARCAGITSEQMRELEAAVSGAMEGSDSDRAGRQ